jgi:hypothetical protein
MRAKCIITFKSSRNSAVSSWNTILRGKDHLSIAKDAIDALKRRQRRKVNIIGLMVYDRDAASA